MTTTRHRKIFGQTPSDRPRPARPDPRDEVTTGNSSATAHNRRIPTPITLTSTSSHLVPTSSLTRGRGQQRPRPSSPAFQGGRGRRHVLTTPLPNHLVLVPGRGHDPVSTRPSVVTS